MIAKCSCEFVSYSTIEICDTNNADGYMRKMKKTIKSVKISSSVNMAATTWALKVSQWKQIGNDRLTNKM